MAEIASGPDKFSRFVVNNNGAQRNARLQKVGTYSRRCLKKTRFAIDHNVGSLTYGGLKC